MCTYVTEVSTKLSAKVAITKLKVKLLQQLLLDKNTFFAMAK